MECREFLYMLLDLREYISMHNRDRKCSLRHIGIGWGFCSCKWKSSRNCRDRDVDWLSRTHSRMHRLEFRGRWMCRTHCLLDGKQCDLRRKFLRRRTKSRHVLQPYRRRSPGNCSRDVEHWTTHLCSLFLERAMVQKHKRPPTKWQLNGIIEKNQK